MKNLVARNLLTIVCLSAISVLSGCSAFQKNTTSPNPDDRGWSMDSWFRKEYQVPATLAVIWSEDVLTMQGATPTRGFGGRVYFYNERSQAIPVKGELIVHGYLTTGRDSGEDKVTADKTFAFTEEQLTTHFSPSELGASYSIWIPWDADGGFREEITLIPTFKPSEGGVIQGAPAKLYLPGQARHQDDMQQGSGLMRSVSYRQSSSPTNNGVKLPSAGESLATRSSQPTDPNSNRLTTTINVPNDGAIARQRSSFLLSPNPRAADSTGAGTRENKRSFTLPQAPNKQPTSRQPSQGELLPEVKTPRINLEDLPPPTGLPSQSMPSLTPPVKKGQARQGLPRWQANLPSRSMVTPASFSGGNESAFAR